MRWHVMRPILLLLPLGLLASCAPAAPPPPVYAPVAEAPAPLPAQPVAIALVNRVTWGADTSSAQAAAGNSVAWLQMQLHPGDDDGLPAQAANQIAAMEISTRNLSQIEAEVHGLQQAAQKAANTPQHDDLQKAYQQKLTDLAHQAAVRALLRDLYSKNQLKEQLTWFWFNHFNVSQNKGEIRAYVGDYEETAIRPHVLGRFADLLAATMFHPAMIQYLDNQQNAAGHINENYARELMELHTLGVGSGYSQKDVQELARILTGIGLNVTGNPPNVKQALRSQYRSGNLFEFNPMRHDYGDKVFLGAPIKGTGLAEATEVINILSRQPATAHFIAAKLAQYFCCENPPPALVQVMASTFLASDGNIAQVLAAMFASPDFTAALGTKFKDPLHYAVSALRAAYGDTVIINEQPLLGWLSRMGQSLYNHETPDGYPMDEASWSGPGALETRFEIARQIGLGHSGLYKLPDPPGAAKAAEPAPPPVIQHTRYAQAVMPTLSPATRQALAQVKSPADWNLLFLSSPEFMRR